MTTTIKTCEPITAMTDVKVCAEAPHSYYDVWGARNMSNQEILIEKERQLQNWADEFNSFLRDHRSLDMVTIWVEREHKKICSACGGEWEGTDTDEIGDYCIICGAYTNIKFKLEQIA